MIGDATHALSRNFGVLIEDEGLALRGTFMINPEGVLLNSEVNFYNMGRNVDELMREPELDGVLVGGAALQAASFLRIVNFRV